MMKFFQKALVALILCVLIVVGATQVRDFLRRYDRFPTNILAKLAGVAMPEEFA